VTARLFEREVDKRLWNPVHRWSKKPVVLVFVLTDTGLLGVGEASTSIGGGAGVVNAVEADLAPLAVGRDIHEVRAIATQVLGKLAINQSFGVLGAALSGLDIALWDLIGQAAGLPVHKLMGTFSRRVYGYASAGLYRDGEGVPELVAEVEGYLAQGYDGMKLKLGGLPQSEDLARVAAVREAMGPDRRLMIDAAGAYDAVQASRFEALVRPYDIYWFEAPIRILDSHGLARFRDRTAIPIAAHEGFFGLHAYDALIRLEAVDFVQFNVTTCGGLTEAHRIAARADAANLATTLQYSGSFVGFAASVQLAATLPRCDSVEVHMVHQWLKEYRDGTEWERRDSYFIPGDRPGIGLSQPVREALLKGE
jgi:L-alanine-DL-glutamate epimerase-like enolase superfamily enzyme